MNCNIFNIIPKYVPPLDKAFIPIELVCRIFDGGDHTQTLRIAIERNNGLIAAHDFKVFAGNDRMAENYAYIERMVKMLLWLYGGYKVYIGGSEEIGNYIQKIYAPGEKCGFDYQSMEEVYEQKFEVHVVDIANVPDIKEAPKDIGRHWDGCRIGLDVGGSDRKVSAVIDGNVVYSEEVIWHPKTQSDPEYHYDEIRAAVAEAAKHMPRVDAIGVSSAGIFINNQARVALLFKKIPKALFEKRIKNIFNNIALEYGVPVEVANDGDVSALAGSMSIEGGCCILGIVMGTSEAVGYVDRHGYVTGHLNELAFAPVDMNPNSSVDEWSSDYGCGSQYFSQDAVIRLAPGAGIQLDEKMTPAEKLACIQKLYEKGDERVQPIFESIGIFFGYTIAFYARFYDIKHILLLGRVSSGEGGKVIVEKARMVLAYEFPELSGININLPDEANRRIGQSVAAASLPRLK